MEEAQRALRQDIEKLDDGITKRLLSQEKVNPVDQDAIMAIAKKILSPFQVELEEENKK